MQARWNVYNQSFHLNVAMAVDRAWQIDGGLELAPVGAHSRALLGPYGQRLPLSVEQSLRWHPIDMDPGEALC